jgi:hypothetical protein
MMFRRRSKSNRNDKLDSSSSSLNNSRNGARHKLDLSNHSINNSRNGSRHNVKHSISQQLPQLRRATVPSTKPIKGILRVKSIDDSLHTVYGRSSKRYSDPGLNDSSVRSTQSDDMYIKQQQQQRVTPSSNEQDEMTKSSSQAMSNSYQSIHRRSNSVLFTAIEIREYERTVGDNPSCSSGPPVS